MAGLVLAQARAFYKTFSTDTEVEAEVRVEAKRLAKELILTDNGGMDVTSASINGQFFGGSRSMTKMQRLLILRAIIKMYDEDVAISSDRSYFRGPS